MPIDFWVTFTPSRTSAAAFGPSALPLPGTGAMRERGGGAPVTSASPSKVTRPLLGRRRAESSTEWRYRSDCPGRANLKRAPGTRNRAESPRDIASETVAQRSGGPEQRDVDQGLFLAQVERGEEGVRRVPHLGDGHDRHHLGRGVQRVVPALPTEPPRPGGKGVRRCEPAEVHRTQLARHRRRSRAAHPVRAPRRALERERACGGPAA